MLGLVACTPSAVPLELQPQPETSTEPAVIVPIDELLLDRGGCYGTCPIYTLYVDETGFVYWEGRQYTDRQGVHTGVVDRRAVSGVFELAESGGYFDAEHEYVPHITDSASAYTSVAIRGRRHWVFNYANGAPPKVRRVERAIDGLLSDVTWDAEPNIAAPATSCLELGWSIARRCDPVNHPAGASWDCDHWYSMWEDFGYDPPQLKLCQLLTNSLHATPTRMGPNRFLNRAGPECQKWIDVRSQACSDDLLHGRRNSTSCGALSHGVLEISEDLESLKSLKVYSEEYCRLPDDFAE